MVDTENKILPDEEGQECKEGDKMCISFEIFHRIPPIIRRRACGFLP